MPVRPLPTYGATPNKMYSIDNPGMGGLVLTREEYKLTPNQSPFMVNMMYRHGEFTKRYGQSVSHTFLDSNLDPLELKNAVCQVFTEDGFIILAHAGSQLIAYNPQVVGEDAHTIVSTPGKFIFDKNDFYYFTQGHIYKISNLNYPIPSSTTVTDLLASGLNPYPPDVTLPVVAINCATDGSTADVVRDFNLLSDYFKVTYHGGDIDEYWEDAYYHNHDTYYVPVALKDLIDPSYKPDVVADGTELVKTTYSWLPPANTHDPTKGLYAIDFNDDSGNVIPNPGVNNVEVTFKLKTAFTTQKNDITGCDHAIRYTGGKSNRLFVAKGDKIYYSYPYDITYFPENNFIDLSNDPGDIQGFGVQYGRLIVFKDMSVYAIDSFTQTDATTLVTEDYGLEGFKVQIVNSKIGCTAPGSIQLFNNNLVWYSSYHGICMLVSTNVYDERNIHIISENVNHGNRYLDFGVLDIPSSELASCVYENKYYLVFPDADGHCFMWDGELSSYNTRYKGGANPEKLTWFYMNGIYANQFVENAPYPIYISNWDNGNIMMQFDEILLDVIFDGNGVSSHEPIHALYMTPVMHFGAVEYLKNVLQFWVQLRTGRQTIIDAYYLTDRDTYAEQDDHSFILNNLPFWQGFQWDTFQWHISQWSDVFRRRLPLKKIKFISFGFEQNTIGMDMPISHIGIQYNIQKLIR